MTHRQADLATVPFSLRNGSTLLKPFGNRELMSEEYLRWMNDRRVTRTIGRFDYLFPVSREKLAEYFHELDPATTLFLAIYHAGEFSGTLKLYDLEPLPRRASLGIMVGPEKWGDGIATSAITAACRYVFDVLGFRKVCAGYVGSNTGMQVVFQKTGFVEEGRLLEHLFIEGRLEDHVFVGRFA